MPSGDILCFGSYALDADARRLTRDGVEVRIACRDLNLLEVFARHPGQLLAKEMLMQSAWPDVEVTPNSLDQAIHRLRTALTEPGGAPCIETQARRGYRFVAMVERVERRASTEAIEQMLQRHLAWVEGRAALETLECGAIGRARDAFAAVVARAPGYAPAHIGLANACALQFEMTRADAEPDIAALNVAHHHAREACERDARNGEAWATYGFVLERIGERDRALAALRLAIELEPDNSRHHLRLSAASWGEERLREARRTLALQPGLAMAHWLAATVFIGRQALDEAERELVAGVAESPDGSHHRYSTVGLHWLQGLLALAAGDSARALESFERELRQELSGHLYARECAANTCYAIGATKRREGDTDGAHAGFEECLRRVPTHPMARAALGMELLPSNGRGPVDSAIAEGISCESRNDGRGCEAAAVKIERALAEAAVSRAGWLLPIEPMLNVSARPELWLRALARLRSCAA